MMTLECPEYYVLQIAADSPRLVGDPSALGVNRQKRMHTGRSRCPLPYDNT